MILVFLMLFFYGRISGNSLLLKVAWAVDESETDYNIEQAGNGPSRLHI